MPTPKQATLYTLILKIFSKFIAYFVIIIIANYFAVEDYGKASFVLSIFLLARTVIQLGVPSSFVPFYVKKKQPNQIFYFVLLLIITATIAMFIFAIKYPWILPLAIALPILFLFSTSIGILQSKHKHHLIQLLGLGWVIFPLIYLILFRDSKADIITAYSSGYIITGLIALFIVRKQFFNLIKKPILKIPRSFLKQAIPIVIIGLAFSFMGQADSSLLGILSTYENVARYTILYKIANIITIIPLSVSMFLLTRTSELKKKKQQKDVLHRSIRITFSFALLSAIALTAFLNLFVNILFKQYIGIEIFVAILLIGIMFYSIRTLIYTYLIGKEKSQHALKPIIISVIINIVLDIILIPRYHLYGIVIATVIAQFTALLLLIKYVDIKLFPITLLSLLVPISYFMGFYGIILIPFIILILFRTKMITMDDIKVLFSTLNSIVKK